MALARPCGPLVPRGRLALRLHVRAPPARGARAHAYFPHHRQHTTPQGLPLPLPGARRVPATPAPSSAPPDARPPGSSSSSSSSGSQGLAAWLAAGPEAWQQGAARLAADAQGRLQAAAAVLAAAYAQAQAAWAHVLVCWPAWRASLAEDAEVVLEYALGVLPAWLAVLRATVLRLCQQLHARAVAHPLPRDVVARSAAAMDRLTAGAARLQLAAASARQQLAASCRPPDAQGLQDLAKQLAPAAAAGGGSSGSAAAAGSQVPAAVAHGGLFFFFRRGRVSDSPQAALAEQPEAAGAALMQPLEPLQQQQPGATAALQAQLEDKRGGWKLPPRRKWADRLFERATKPWRGVGAALPASPELNEPAEAQPLQQQLEPEAVPAEQQEQEVAEVQEAEAPATAASAVAAEPAAAAAVEAPVPDSVEQRSGEAQAPQLQLSLASVGPQLQLSLDSLGPQLQHSLASVGPELQRSLASVLAQGQAVAGKNAQQALTVLVTPLQQAGFARADGCGPTVAGIVAAASVVLAGAVARAIAHQRCQSQERAAQQAQLQMKAEVLAAQRARFRRVLGDSQARDGRRAAPSPTAAASDEDWEAGVAASAPFVAGAELAAGSPGASRAGSPADAAGGGALGPLELDATAEREFRAFMAGARAVGVEMWDNGMLDDLPKLSKKELERQTQKIRAAASQEERDAMQDAGKREQLLQDQLNGQLQQLAQAPMGRAAREAWRLEQQQQQQPAKEQAERSRQEAEAEARRSAAPKRSASAAGARPEAASAAEDGRSPRQQPAPATAKSAGSGGGGGSNPFAISSEARAQWFEEDGEFTDPNPRPAQRGRPSLLAGLLGFGRKQQQQQQQQAQEQPRRPRRSRPQSPAAQPAPSASRSTSVFGSTLPPKQPAREPQPPPVPGPQQQAADTSAVLEGLEEGSPEWAAAMRAEMLRSGAARRARRQQQQTGLAGSAATGQRPDDGSSKLAAAVSAQDARAITAAVPPMSAAGAQQRDAAAAATAEAAAVAAESDSAGSRASPLAVDGACRDA